MAIALWQVASQFRSGSGVRCESEIEIRPTSGLTSADQRVDVARLARQRAVHGVADRHLRGRPERRRQRARVVVDDVVLLGLRVAGEGVVEVGHGQPDPHAGRLVVAGDQVRPRLRVAGCEQGDVVAAVDRPSARIETTHSMPP